MGAFGPTKGVPTSLLPPTRKGTQPTFTSGAPPARRRGDVSFEPTMLRPHLVSTFGVLPLLGVLYVSAACSDSSGEDAGDGKGGAGGTGSIVLGGKSGTNPGTGGSATVSGGGTTSCTLEDDGSGCVGAAYEGETVGLDIYVMFDQSGSMCSCIDPA